jgi:nucleoside-diphosphate-sugar epimerase
LSVSQSAQPVVVLGANGFVGRRVVQYLAATETFRPIAAVRKPVRNDTTDVEWRICDAVDAASVAAALADCAYAVNCVGGDAKTMEAATHNLCQGGMTAKLRRIVHVSSMSVYGPVTGLIEEKQPLDPSGSWYARAKVASEAMMQRFAAAGGDGVILRPGCIHGPESEQWTILIGRLLASHRIGDLGLAGDGLCNLTYIDDIAAAVVAALQRPGIAGEAFNVSDPDPGPWNRYFVAFGRGIGATPVRRISLPWLRVETALAAPLKLASIAAGLAGIGRLPFDPLPRSLLPLWRQDIQLDHRKADAGLGFARTAPDQAIAHAAAWFKAWSSRSAQLRPAPPLEANPGQCSIRHD